MAEIWAAEVSVVRLVDTINPHVSSNEPSELEELDETAERIQALLFISTLVSQCACAASIEESSRSGDY